MSTWQPIATAPKDGTEILVYDGFDLAEGHVDIASWDRDRWSNCEGFTLLPTHWMPLPEPPK